MADTYDPESSNNEEDKDLQQTVADTPETAFKIYYDALYEEANFVRAHPMRKVVHRYWVCSKPHPQSIWVRAETFQPLVARRRWCIASGPVMKRKTGAVTAITSGLKRRSAWRWGRTLSSWRGSMGVRPMLQGKDCDGTSSGEAVWAGAVQIGSDRPRVLGV